jgi:hypothetical protein
MKRGVRRNMAWIDGVARSSIGSNSYVCYGIIVIAVLMAVLMHLRAKSINKD